MKRQADRQLIKEDDIDDFGSENQEDGTWKKADGEVISKRRILKGKRSGTSGTLPDLNPNNTETNQDTAPKINWNFGLTNTQSSENNKTETNPIKTTTTTEGSDNDKQIAVKDDEKKETEGSTEGEGVPTEGVPTEGVPTEGVPTGGVPAEGVPTEGIPTGGIPTEGVPTAFSLFGATLPQAANANSSIFGMNIAPPKESEGQSSSPFSFVGNPNNFTNVTKPSTPLLQTKTKDQLITGEEDEETLFSTKAKLYELTKEEIIKEEQQKTENENENEKEKDMTERWTERGVGLIKLNKSKKDNNQSYRLIMRTDVIYRVILNCILLWDTAVELPTEKTLRLVALNTDENNQTKVGSFLIRVSNGAIANELLDSIKNQQKNLPKIEPSKEIQKETTTNQNNSKAATPTNETITETVTETENPVETNKTEPETENISNTEISTINGQKETEGKPVEDDEEIDIL